MGTTRARRTAAQHTQRAASRLTGVHQAGSSPRGRREPEPRRERADTAADSLRQNRRHHRDSVESSCTGSITPKSCATVF